MRRFPLVALCCWVVSLLTAPCVAQNGRFAVGAKASTLGIGGEVGVAVAPRANVRFGFNAFTYNHDFTKDGIDYAGKLTLRSAELLFDQYIAGGFHISPGLLVYNNNHGDATASVPGGNAFSLGDNLFQSSRANPVSGSGTLTLGKAAPMVLIGFGNLLPRHRHIGVNLEFGVVFQGSPDVKLQLEGATCNAQGNNCVNVGVNPLVQSGLVVEQNKINDSLSPFKYYPVISLGIGYKF